MQNNYGWDDYLKEKYGYVPNSICFKCLQGDFDFWQAEKNLEELEKQEAIAKQNESKTV